MGSEMCIRDSVGTPPLRLTPPPRDTPPAPAKLDALATLLNCNSLIPSRVIDKPIGNDNCRLSRRASPQCVTSPSAGLRPCQLTFVLLPVAQPPAFTAGCGLVRRSVSSPGTKGSVFFGAGLRLCPTRGVAPLLPRHGAPQGSPRLVQGRRWVVVAWKNQCEYDGGWGIPGPNFGRSGAVQAPSFPGTLHDLRGDRTRFLVPAGSRIQRVLSGGST